MTSANNPLVPAPSAEHRKAASGQFERAQQVMASGNHDYAIRLLLSCCKLEPANLIYRQMLRRTEKAKYRNNLRGQVLAWLRTWRGKARVKAALRGADYQRVLVEGEIVLARNPWDVPTQMAMAEAADNLGLLDLAIWNLEQARQKTSKDIFLNRTLARLYEKRGNFTQAIALWELVRKVKADDGEAQRKLLDLAATETISRGQYNEVIAGEQPAPTNTSANSTAPPTEEHLSPKEARLIRETSPVRARIQKDPTLSPSYLQLARIYRDHGEFAKARDVLAEGLGPTGGAFELTTELADLEIEPFRRNLAHAEEKLKAAPDDADLRKLRARLRKEINTRELDLFRQKADRYPTDMTFRMEVGMRLLRAGQVDEAIKALQEARNDLKVRWHALMYLGHCFKARNNWRLAQRNFEEALQSMPNSEKSARKELLFMLAQGAAEAGEWARAIELGSELANEDFTYRDIGRLLDEWQARPQQPKVSG